MSGKSAKDSLDDISGIISLIMNTASRHTLSTIEAPAQAIFKNDSALIEKYFSELVETVKIALAAKHKEFMDFRPKFNQAVEQHQNFDSISGAKEKKIKQVCEQYVAIVVKMMYFSKGLYIMYTYKNEPSILLLMMQTLSLVMSARAQSFYYSYRYEESPAMSYIEYLEFANLYDKYFDQYQDMVIKQYREVINAAEFLDLYTFTQVSELIKALLFMSRLSIVFADFNHVEQFLQRASMLFAALGNTSGFNTDLCGLAKSRFEQFLKESAELKQVIQTLDRKSSLPWKALFESYSQVFIQFAQPRTIEEGDAKKSIIQRFDNYTRNLKKIHNKTIQAILPLGQEIAALLTEFCTHFDDAGVKSAHRCLDELSHALSLCPGFRNNHLAWCLKDAISSIKLSMNKYEKYALLLQENNPTALKQNIRIAKVRYKFAGLALMSHVVVPDVVVKRAPKRNVKTKVEEAVSKPIIGATVKPQESEETKEVKEIKQVDEAKQQQTVDSDKKIKETLEPKPAFFEAPAEPQAEKKLLPSIEEIHGLQEENRKKFGDKLERKESKEIEKQESEIKKLTEAFSKVILDAKKQHQEVLKAMRESHQKRLDEIKQQHQGLLDSFTQSSAVEDELLKQELSEEERKLLEQNKIEIDAAWVKAQQRINFLKQQARVRQLPDPITSIDIPLTTKIILNILEEHEVEYFILGGFVRNRLLDSPMRCSDIDVIVNQEPAGLPSGILKFVTKDPRLPRLLKVGEIDFWCEPWPSIEAVLTSKDFKFNTLAAKANGQVYDLLNCGLKALYSPEIELMGDVSRYRKDPVLILRTIRFCVHLDKHISQRDGLYIKANRSLLRNIEVSAYIKNIERIFISKHLAQDFASALKHNVLSLLFPISEDAYVIHQLQNRPILKHYISHRFDKIAQKPINTDSVYYFIALILLMHYDMSRPNLAPNINLMEVELEHYFVWLGTNSKATSCLLANAKLTAILFGSAEQGGLFHEYYSGKQQIEQQVFEAQRTLTPSYHHYANQATQTAQALQVVHYPNKVSASNLFVPGKD